MHSIARRRAVVAALGIALGASSFAATGTASAVTDPYPNAPICVVSSDHVTVSLATPKGTNSNSVKEAQCWLNRHGAKLTVDGKFGPASDAATKAFQRSHGLTADGKVGPATWKALIYGTPAAPTDRDAKVAKVLGFARAQFGKPYVWGADGPSSYDCSGLTMRAYQQIGINMPHKADRQPAGYRAVSRSQALPGDLVHWSGHVGIYAGNGRVVHASRSQKKVVESNLWGSPTFHRVF